MIKKLDLSMVTLLCVETREPSLGEWAIEKCTTHVSFAKVVLVTDLAKVKNWKAGIDYIESPSLQSVQEYSQFMMSNLSQYVLGTHVLVIQWDSFITNPMLWDKKFLEYDYIGAVWPHHPHTPVGNGGFSLRSIKLLQALTKSDINIGHPEDYCICAENRELLQDRYHIQFAPVNIAEQFAVERTEWHPAFGFHGFFNFANVMDEEELIQIINIIPKKMFCNLDTYDLLKSVKSKKLNNVKKIIRSKLTFNWKYRYKYLKEKFI